MGMASRRTFAIPEWTTWTLLVAIDIYDLGAVLILSSPLEL